MLQGNAWRTWREHIALQRVKRAALLPYVQRIQQGMLGRLFRGWRDTGRKHATLRATEVACTVQLRRLLLSKALAFWSSWCAHGRRQRFASSFAVQP